MKTSSGDGVPDRKTQDGQRDVTAFQGELGVKTNAR